MMECRNRVLCHRIILYQGFTDCKLPVAACAVMYAKYVVNVRNVIQLLTPSTFQLQVRNSNSCFNDFHLTLILANYIASPN